MKKLIYIFLVAFAVTSCKQKDYVTLDVKLDGLKPSDSTLTILGQGFMKQIKLNKEGVFKDTFKIKEAGFYGIRLGENQISAFLRNGNTLNITGKSDDIDNTLGFSGKGSQNSTYLNERVKEVGAFSKSLQEDFKLDSTAFNAKVNEFEKKMTELLKNTKKPDTMLVRVEKEGLSGFVKSLKQQYTMMNAQMQKFTKGTPSPKFVNYENYKGGKTSLDDLKGKFVYIDVWATWCQPCVGQIPALKELEEQYRGKNIEFVSISTDRKEDYNKWKEMVAKEQLKGVQLYFGDDMSFMQAYDINSIPRFIFLDPNGNIVDANATRPSDKEGIKKLFAEAGVK